MTAIPARHSTEPASPTASAGDSKEVRQQEANLVRRLKQGDESAFLEMVDELHDKLVKTAGFYVRNRAVAEEVVQDTWIAVLRGIGRFEHRCSLRTWVYGIMLNRARSTGRSEGRFDELRLPTRIAAADTDDFERKLWQETPVRYDRCPETMLLDTELRTVLNDAVASLPPRQREVVLLRDIEGFSSNEVRSLLGLSEGNERVLLHRARVSVREVVHQYLTA